MSQYRVLIVRSWWRSGIELENCFLFALSQKQNFSIQSKIDVQIFEYFQFLAPSLLEVDLEVLLERTLDSLHPASEQCCSKASRQTYPPQFLGFRAISS